ncbi:MAG TPA: AI-2E family transporter, partial [Flavobacterium sp.]
VPLIVSSKVEVNAFVSIIGIIIGGTMVGVAGMFLAIPLIAIMKVIFIRVEELKPWGYLMGDDLPKTFEWGRLKFPYYRPGPANTVNADIQTPVIFTETTTTEPRNEDINKAEQR